MKKALFGMIMAALTLGAAFGLIYVAVTQLLPKMEEESKSTNFEPYRMEELGT